MTIATERVHSVAYPVHTFPASLRGPLPCCFRATLDQPFSSQQCLGQRTSDLSVCRAQGIVLRESGGSCRQSIVQPLSFHFCRNFYNKAASL